MFMFTAILGGVSLTLLASMLAARITPKAKVNDTLIERVAQVLGYMMIAYLYWRFWDWLAQTYTYEPGRTEGFRLLTKGPLSFNFWFGEMLFGGDPIALIFHRDQHTRQDHIRRCAKGKLP